MKTHYSIKDGLPTGPDVAIIRKEYQDLSHGDEIPYENLEQLLGLKRNTSRFRAVTDAWRRQLKEQQGLVIGCAREHGFYVATPEQIVSTTTETLAQIGRKARRQRENLGTIHPEKEADRDRIQHHMRILLHVEQNMKTERKNLAPPSKHQTLPLPYPPRGV